jgi:hypothetical protein
MMIGCRDVSDIQIHAAYMHNESAKPGARGGIKGGYAP